MSEASLNDAFYAMGWEVSPFQGVLFRLMMSSAKGNSVGKKGGGGGRAVDREGWVILFFKCRGTLEEP